MVSIPGPFPLQGERGSGLAAGTAVARNDLLFAIDVSDTTMASSGTTKKLAVGDYLDDTSSVVDALDVPTGATDATTALQAQLDAAAALQQSGATLDRRPEVQLRPHAYYSIGELDIPQNVVLNAMGSELRALSGGAMVNMADFSVVKHALFRGLGAGTTLVGVDVPSGTTWSTIWDCRFDSFGSSAINIAGNATRVYDCFAQNCVLDDAALAAPTGVLHIEGSSANDNWVANCEFTASQLALSASGNAYAVVDLGKSNRLEGVIAEISDHGFYINALHYRYSDCRADLNRGHGWVFAGGEGSVVGCSSLSNGREATNTYDGYFISAGSHRFAACSANVLSTLTSVKHRYGFNDTSSTTLTGSVFDASCWSDQHATKPINVTNDPSSKVVCTDGPFMNTSGSGTTWDVQTYRWPHNCWNLAAGSARNLSTLTNGVPGQRVTLRGDGNTTLVHNGSFGADSLRLLGGVNLLTVTHTLYEFVRLGGGFWVQV